MHDFTLGCVCANIHLLITQMRCGVCSAGWLFGLMLSEEPFALLWAAPAKARVIKELTVVAENVRWQERVEKPRFCAWDKGNAM